MELSGPRRAKRNHQPFQDPWKYSGKERCEAGTTRGQPYQPYQLLSISYDDGPFLTTAKEAIAAAQAARGQEIKRVLDEVKAVESEGLAIFLTGDFNEPSHLDWSAAAARTQCCPLEVEWPTTKAVMDAGFVDSYREVFLIRPAIGD